MRSRIAMVKIFKPTSEGSDGTIYSFRFPDVYMDFSISSPESQEPGSSVVSIHGISINSYQMFETIKDNKYSDRQKVEVLYGLESTDPSNPERDLEVVFSGSIERVQYLFDNGKQTMKIVCGERSKEFFSKTASISLNGQVQVKDLITAVATNFGYKIIYEGNQSEIELMPIGRVSEKGTLKKILDRNLPKEVSFYHSGDKIVIFKGTKQGIFKIDAEVGQELLAYPDVDTKTNRVNLRARILPQIKTGTILRIPAISETLFARGSDNTELRREFVVEKYRISFNNGVGVMDLECSEKKEKEE